MLSTRPLPPDSRGHSPNCKHFGEPPDAGEDRGYADLFCDCHKWEAPRVLPGGTNVAWPAGWNVEMAAEWRAQNNLTPPSEPGLGFNPQH
jgi:hypothetical protein